MRIEGIEKLNFFESAILILIFFKFFLFLFYPHENQPKFLGQQGWIEILMINLVSRKFLAMRNITLYSVYIFFSGRQFKYNKALEIVNDEKYLEDLDFDKIRGFANVDILKKIGKFNPNSKTLLGSGGLWVF